MITDFFSLLQWYFIFLIIGIVFFPITNSIFRNFPDRGYIFSKILGIALLSYSVFFLSITKLIPFTTVSIILVLFIFLVINILVAKRTTQEISKKNIIIFVFEEILFLICLLFWAFVRGHEPSIHGLEKFMDFGFINSILRAKYLPPPDIWFTPYPINYYYFGHFTVALLTKLSFLPSYITYNLMLSTLFAFTFTGSFSLGAAFFGKSFLKKNFLAGLLSAVFVSLAGNLHTIYTFFTPYKNDSPVSPLNLSFAPFSFPNSYWYPNATRFIPFTIHEFPLYSFVVSDLHGHVIDIPFVLLGIALIYKIFSDKKVGFSSLILASLILSIMYMTNAWDAIIYGLLFFLCITFIYANDAKYKLAKILSLPNLLKMFKSFTMLFAGIIAFTLPFSIHFKPFVSGLGIICPPNFLVQLGHIGPFLFEPNHCQRSPFWQLLILYGFFYFFVFTFVVFFLKRVKAKKIQETDFFMLILIFVSTILIIIPEFVYAKDIYPAHYRANTMFKLVYQAFILLSLFSGFVVVRILSAKKNILFFFATLILSTCVLLYPFFAVFSYYSNLKNYAGQDGLLYLKTIHPQDYDAVIWINKNITGQPVIVEAQGDSYTDFARISSNTGLPTILGWTVHEWLWRGTYDIPAPRIAEVQTIYEGEDSQKTTLLLDKYHVSYVYVGDLEREKYPRLFEEKFQKTGTKIYDRQNTKIYKIKY